MSQHPETPSSADAWRKVLLGCVIAITVILVGWMLRATAVVMIPLVFSVFLALLVAPVDRWGARHAPRRAPWLGHAAAMGAILLVLLVFIGSIWIAAQQVVDRLPTDMGGSDPAVPLAGPARPEASAPSGEPSRTDQASGATTSSANDDQGNSSTNEDQGQSAANEDQGKDAGLFATIRSRFASAGGSFLGRLADWAAGYASTILSTAWAVLGGAILVFFLTLMMLIEGRKWRDKMLLLVRPSSEGGAMRAVGEIAERLRKYLWARTMIGAATAFLYMGWLWIFGLDLVFVWGLLAFLLNYIPTLGSLIAGVAPAVYAFVTRDFGTAALIAGGLLAIEQVMGNYIDPRVQGRQVSLSPLVVLIVLLFWGWIWGIAGAILAVPITIALLIVSAHVRPLRPLAVMLSNETDAAGLEKSIGATAS